MQSTTLSSLLERTEDEIPGHEQPFARATIDETLHNGFELNQTDKARLKAQLGKISISEHDFHGALLHFRAAGIQHNLLAVRVALCYLNLAPKLRNGNLHSEIQDLDSRKQDNPEILLVRGLFEISRFQDAAARNDFLSVIDSFPEYPSQLTEAHRRLVELPLISLSHKETDIELATAHLHLEKLRDMDPTHPQIATLEGLLALRKNDLDQAIAIFEQKGITSTPYNMTAVLGTTLAHLQHEAPHKQNRGKEWIQQSLDKIKPGSLVSHYLKLRAKTLFQKKENTTIPRMLQRGVEQGETHLLYLLLLASLNPSYDGWPATFEKLKTASSIPFAKESLEMVLNDPTTLASFELPLLLREMLCDEAPMRILQLKF